VGRLRISSKIAAGFGTEDGYHLVILSRFFLLVIEPPQSESPSPG
jgi:hypothetical protein